MTNNIDAGYGRFIAQGKMGKGVPFLITGDTTGEIENQCIQYVTDLKLQFQSLSVNGQDRSAWPNQYSTSQLCMIVKTLAKRR